MGCEVDAGRPWYVGAEREREPVWFATGGLFVARVAWLREHDFPDRAMVKKQDDILLGKVSELLSPLPMRCVGTEICDYTSCRKRVLLEAIGEDGLHGNDGVVAYGLRVR